MKTISNYLRLILIATLSLFTFISHAFTGAGKASYPFQISNQTDFITLQQQVNNGNTYAGKYFILTRNITLQGSNFGIGHKHASNSDYQKTQFFEGNFDGNNYTLSIKENFFSFNTSMFCVFQAIRNANISNLTVASQHEGYCGIINLAQNATIKNCINKNNIIQSDINQLSGIVNISQGCTITNCSNYGDIKGENWCAGIIGQINQDGDAHTLVKDCNNYGNIYVKQDYAGGITANATSNLTIIHCSNQGKIEGRNYIGGIASNMQGNCHISTSMNNGTISCYGNLCGGIVGSTKGQNNSIIYCGNYGNINILPFWNNHLFAPDTNYAAGIIGYDYDATKIEDCIQTAQIQKIKRYKKDNKYFKYIHIDPIVNRTSSSSIIKSYYDKQKLHVHSKHKDIIKKTTKELQGFSLREGIDGKGWTESNWIFENDEYPFPIPYKHNATPTRANVRFMNDGALYDQFTNISELSSSLINHPDNKFNKEYNFIGWSTDTTSKHILVFPHTITKEETIQHASNNYDLILYAIWENKNSEKEYHINATLYITNNFIPKKENYNNIILNKTGHLIVNNELSLHCNKLILIASKDNMPQIDTQSDITITNGWIYSRIIDDLRWYNLALPYNCNIQNISSSNQLSIYDRNWVIKKYDAEKRCINGHSTINWSKVDIKSQMINYEGYILGTTIKEPQLLYFKPNQKQIRINAQRSQLIHLQETSAETDKNRNKNWNFVGSPFLNNIHGSASYIQKAKSTRSPKEVFITYPIIKNGIHFYQGTLSNLGCVIKPFLPMYIQIEEETDINFTENNSIYYVSANNENYNANYTKLTLQITDQNKKVDNTTITFEEAGKEEYEIGYDYDKIINSSDIQVYSISKERKMKSNNLPNKYMNYTALGINLDTVGGYYTFQIISSEGNTLDEVYLTDHDTGEITNLMNTTYSFYGKKLGENNNRFSIQLSNKTTTPTEINPENRATISTLNNTIQLSNLENINNIRLINSVGQLIKTLSINNSNQEIKELIKGVYFVTFECKNGRIYTLKVMI